MRPFDAGDDSYARSIAIDASTIGDITVTVAVSANRIDELEILESIYEAAEGFPFFPFRDKSHDIEYEESVEFFETVVDTNSHRLTATTHLGQDGSDQERIEAVQSAVLVSELGLDDALVILDGNEDKAERFGRGITGIVGSCPPIATCIQSELYYPTSLLADICASHLAYQIDHPRHCSEVTPKAPITKETFNHYWGPAYNEMVTSSDAIYTEPIEQRRADTVRTRMNCWFEGKMGGGEPVRFDSSVQPIVQYARNQGYEELATKLSEI
ncbi:hypothetical protein [Haloferax sp. Atlit-48N]|uniref:Uncharacterized protein n=1 Tax=Haloferax sp. Atlit-48N TaxID=2077198 RepID=A0ACD5I1K8_9EURY|nr:hypothetical protein [Haloferax sp. Atlit-48N]RDZ30294.1 hypothetical protein DEQ67_14600 [Haloferax sp. Atlit-48N]